MGPYGLVSKVRVLYFPYPELHYLVIGLTLPRVMRASLPSGFILLRAERRAILRIALGG